MDDEVRGDCFAAYGAKFGSRIGPVNGIELLFGRAMRSRRPRSRALDRAFSAASSSPADFNAWPQARSV